MKIRGWEIDGFGALRDTAVEGLPDYGLPAAFGTCMLIFSGLVSLIYMNVLRRAHRYQVVTGKAWRPRLAPLGGLAPLAWGFAGFYVLCALDVRDAASLESGLKYLVTGSVGSAALLFGSGLAYISTGSLRFDLMRRGADEAIRSLRVWRRPL